MKKALSLPFLILFSVIFLHAQAPKFEWVRAAPTGGSLADLGAETYDFTTDKAGNTYLYGTYYSSKLDFGNGVTLLNPDENEVFFLAKIQPNGTAAWATPIVTVPDTTALYANYASGLAVDDAGNVFISGSFDAAALDFGNGISLTRGCSNCSHVFVASYNSSGVVKWVRLISSVDDALQQAGKIAVSGNSLYLTGIFEGPEVDFGPGFQFTNLQSSGFFLEKMNTSDGNPEWVKFPAPNGSSSVGYQVKTTPTGDVWVAGSYDDKAIDFGNKVVLESIGDFSTYNYFLVQYSSKGEALTAINLNSPDYMDILDMSVDGQLGGVYVVCDFSDTLRNGNIPLAYQGSDYAGCLLYSIGGSVSSVLQVPYNGNGYGITGVTAAAGGDYYISGLFDDATLTVGDTMLENKGGFDSYLMRGNVGGGTKWIRSVGGIGNEAITGFYYGQALSLDAKGSLYVNGAYLAGMQIDGNIKLGSGLLVGKLKAETVSAPEPSSAQYDFQLTPNPTSGAFRVDFGKTLAEGRLVIHDLQGREIYSQKVAAPVTEISQPLATGAYTLSFITEDQVVRKKLVVQTGN